MNRAHLRNEARRYRNQLRHKLRAQGTRVRISVLTVALNDWVMETVEVSSDQPDEELEREDA